MNLSGELEDVLFFLCCNCRASLKLNPVDLGRYSVSKREINDLDLYDCWKVFDDVCQVSPLVVGLFSL